MTRGVHNTAEKIREWTAAVFDYAAMLEITESNPARILRQYIPPKSQSVRGTARRRLAAESRKRQMATPAQTQRHEIPLLRPHQRSPARNGEIAKSNHTDKTNSINKGRLK